MRHLADADLTLRSDGRASGDRDSACLDVRGGNSKPTFRSRRSPGTRKGPPAFPEMNSASTAASVARSLATSLA